METCKEDMQNPELITREMGSKVVQLGSSLVVHCVQELAKVNTAAIPPRYIRPPHQEQPAIIPSCEIPVVDLQRLLDQESMDPELPKLHLACKDGGSVQEEQQINVEVSRAAAAEEEAQGKGLVDGIMEVQESSGPLQPKSLNGLPSASAGSFRQRHGFKEKSKLEQVVIEVSLDSSTDGYLASKQAAEIAGKQSSKEPMKDIMEDEPVLIKEEENEPVLQPPVSPSIPHCLHPISESAGDTGGTMEMESGTNTHSNPSQENAESSCKSKTAEWALPVTSVVLEATSAIFEQLGYPLTSMVMAFVALLLSILDLILKARERGITCDGRGLLPCFYRHSSHDVRNRKPFASLVQYFGLAGALWQCSFTIVGYHYTHHKLVNPIKLCLLPFILAFCLLISKVVKSSQHER